MEINFKGIKEIDLTTKSIVLSILAVMPFWFVSLFLFDKELVINNAPYISVVFCICFSVLWFLINVGLSAIVMSMLEENDINASLFVGGFISVIYLSVVILILYIVDRNTCYHISYLTFLIFAFCYILFRMILVVGNYKKIKSSVTELKEKLDNI